MDPFHAKLVAAATGSTMTALTSTMTAVLISPLTNAYSFTHPVTPFDVVKTRLQTQPKVPLFSRTTPPNTCCQPTHIPCVRNMSSYTRTLAAEEVVCVFDHGVYRTERVNGFLDAVRHVWRVEGVRGLWKGAGTTL